ncbi:MAG: HAD-IIIA family hydrolase [Opitutaceae bacterium]|nr:HAD-IIIA family hydrolase [Opitutaceae bacterium]
MVNESSSSLNWNAIELFAMDVDGVLTDGCIYVSSDGSETKRFSIIDGLGLVKLREAGVKIAWISGRGSEATTKRANELKIEYVVQGRKDKVTALASLLEELNLNAEQAVYMGDDTIDTEAIELAGIGVAVPEAQPEPLAAANYVTVKTGGNGAVREVCNHILSARSQ